MPKFISDEDMEKLDPTPVAKPKGFLSDDEMAAHEASFGGGEDSGGVLSTIGKGLDAINLGKRFGIGNEARAKMVAQDADMLQKYGGMAPDLAEQRAGKMLELAQSGGTLAGGIKNVADVGPSIGEKLVEGGVNGLSGVTDNIAARLGKGANSLRANASDLTGAQIDRLGGAQKVGETLKPHTSFGSNAEGIAGKLRGGVKSAEDMMGSAMGAATEKGVTADVENVVNSLEKRIEELSGDPSQAAVVRKLERIRDNVIETGRADVPVAEAEATKRGFQSQSNYSKPITTMANKEAARAYAGEVENAMNQADPEMAAQFKEGKQAYGSQQPVLKAMDKRLSTSATRNGVGLKDVVAGAKGGPLGFGASLLTKGRLASSGAVTLDKIGDIIEGAPHLLGKFAKPLAVAAERGPQAVAAADFILQQRDPEYRETLRKIRSGEAGEDPEANKFQKYLEQ